MMIKDVLKHFLKATPMVEISFDQFLYSFKLMFCWGNLPMVRIRRALLSTLIDEEDDTYYRDRKDSSPPFHRVERREDLKRREDMLI